jgi:hypothetical protein
LLALAEGIKRFNTLGIEILNINNTKDVENVFIPLLKDQGSCYTKYQNSLKL